MLKCKHPVNPVRLILRSHAGHGNQYVRRLMKTFLLVFCCLPIQVLADNKELPPIYVGVKKNAQPYSIIDSKGKATGILVDFFNKFCAHLGRDCEYDGGHFSDLLNGLNTDKIDALIVSTQVVLPEIDNVLLTPPICKLNPVFIQRSLARPYFKQIADMKNQRIAVQEGSPLHLYLIKNHLHIAHIKSYHILESAIFDLFTDRIDAIFVDEAFYQDRVYNTSLGDAQYDIQLIATQIADISIPFHTMAVAFSKQQQALYEKAVQFISEPGKEKLNCAGLLNKSLSIIY